MSLCRVEFADFVNVCDNWTTLLQGTSQTFTSCQNTENIFTSATSVHTREELVGAPSSFEEYFGIGTEDIDFVVLLEILNSELTIGDTYCDTYLRAADASTQKMSNYLIDINIYRCVLRQYMY